MDIFVGATGKELFELTLEMEMNPNDKAKARLAEIYKKIDKEAVENHNTKAEKFILEYGQVLYRFIERLENKKNFLAYKDNFYFSWEVKRDGNEDYWMIRFQKGKFNYILDIAGGYGGEELLEENISKEQVLKLLNK